MRRTLTATDILNSVEFELLAGALSQDELGVGLQKLRSYQHKAHSALYDPARSAAPTVDDLADLQLQLNEMLLTLVEVLGRRVDAARLEARRVGALVEEVELPELAGRWRERSALAVEGNSLADGELISRSIPVQQAAVLATVEPLASIEASPLTIELDVRPVRVPLIGGILTRLRTALHQLVVYYVRQLAQQQNQTNAAYLAQLTRLVDTVQAHDAELRTLYVAVERADATANRPESAVGADRT